MSHFSLLLEVHKFSSYYHIASQLNCSIKHFYNSFPPVSQKSAVLCHSFICSKDHNCQLVGAFFVLNFQLSFNNSFSFLMFSI
jgi:hypothetical protein